jgi:anti-anti-sigma factor
MVDVSRDDVSEPRDAPPGGIAGGTLRIEPVVWDGQRRVAVVGEIDLANVGDAEALLTPLAERGSAFVLDVVGLTYCDSQGVAMLFRLAQRAKEHGGSLTIANAHGIVRRVLEITAVADAIPIVVDL